MYDYRCTLVRGIDGDSIVVLADLGFHARMELELRLLDVHAPELAQLGGPETTGFVNDWLTRVAAVQPIRRWPLYVTTVQTKVYEPNERQTFTRYLATVWPFDRRGPEDSLNFAVTQFLAGHPDWPPGG